MPDLLAGHEPPVPLSDQISCIEREIKMREHVYPRRVAEKKMSQAKADHEMRAMRAVLTTLKGIS